MDRDTSYSGGAAIWKIARLNGNEFAARRVLPGAVPGET